MPKAVAALVVVIARRDKFEALAGEVVGHLHYLFAGERAAGGALDENPVETARPAGVADQVTDGHADVEGLGSGGQHYATPSCLVGRANAGTFDFRFSPRMGITKPKNLSMTSSCSTRTMMELCSPVRAR